MLECNVGSWTDSCERSRAQLPTAYTHTLGGMFYVPETVSCPVSQVFVRFALLAVISTFMRVHFYIAEFKTKTRSRLIALLSGTWWLSCSITGTPSRMPIVHIGWVVHGLECKLEMDYSSFRLKTDLHPGR